MSVIRPPAVAGSFYPADATALRDEVDTLLDAAPAVWSSPPKALIVPHAGYRYSGATAGRAYGGLRPWAKQIRRVVLLGPLHRVSVRGLALPAASHFATPLGAVPLDQAGMAALHRYPWVVESALAHQQEHALEVHLPFLQRVLDTFEVLPLGIGAVPPETLGEVIDACWGGPETLFVISTDLSHYLPASAAEAQDARTRTRILNLATDLHPADACGAFPLNAFLQTARRRDLRIEAIHHCHSGDAGGNSARVVGYAAFALFEAAPAPVHTQALPADNALGIALLQRARQAINAQLHGDALPTVDLPALGKIGATFVTLTRHGQLRGCIGSLVPHRSLADDITHNALAAAFRDPRFAPMSTAEWADTQVEVSLLGPAEPLTFRDEADARAQLRPGIDGLVLTSGRHRATFLPQVWAQLPDPADFLAHLKQKAGLAPDAWPADLTLARYQVEKWREKRR
jgi:AmmeMemoRadiSam system protein B/AmmeMemoRadiSam system protein A